jgi:hypothetical protein
MSGVMTELQINNEENDGASAFGQLDILSFYKNYFWWKESKNSGPDFKV